MKDYLTFDEAGLVKLLSKLDRRCAAAFGFLCAIRLVNTVKGFYYLSAEELSIITDSKDTITTCILEKKLPPAYLEQRLIEISPTEDDDSSIQGGTIEDACAALIYTVRAICADSDVNASLAARRAYEAVDRYAASFIKSREYNEEFELAVLSNDKVQLELSRQNRDLSLISEIGFTKLITNEGGEEIFIL